MLFALCLFNGDDRAWAQGNPVISLGPFIHQDTLVLEAGASTELGGRRLAIVGDTALVATMGSVSVYDRNTTTDLWTLVTHLAPDDAAENFGRVVSFDGRRAIVGAAGAAYVFRRQAGGAHDWHQIARLVPSDLTANFGAGVAIDGRYALVGAVGNLQANVAGSVFVFKRTADGWQEIAKLAPPTNAPLRFGFGFDVDISGDTAIVGAGPGTARAFIFGRDQGGVDNWGVVTDMPGGLQVLPVVAIDGDTAVVGGGADSFPGVGVFGRNEGGPNAWGPQRAPDPDPVCCGAITSVSISGDYIIAGTSILAGHIQIRARNQGGPNAWGLVSLFDPQRASQFVFSSVAIDGDTALLDTDPTSNNDTVSVLVSDVDGDGIRDGRDSCRRDPLNNVAGHCQRSTANHPVLDDLIAQGNVTSETQGRRHLITATFTNTSTTAVKNPFFEVTELTGGNRLLNADEGRGGVGATLSPDVGDGVLSPGESMSVTFRIRLRTQNPFQFFVAFHGDLIP